MKFKPQKEYDKDTHISWECKSCTIVNTRLKSNEKQECLYCGAEYRFIKLN